MTTAPRIDEMNTTELESWIERLESRLNRADAEEHFGLEKCIRMVDSITKMHNRRAALAEREPRRVEDTDASVEGTHRCARCAGTGNFVTHVENGIPKGPGGTCFRCGGKGVHDQADRKRNDYHDRHRTVRL